jgi:antitoxin MazE
MKTKIVKIGNSQGIVLSKSLINQYNFEGEVEVHAQAEGLFITPISKPARHDWEERFKTAIANGEDPETEMLEGFNNEFDNDEWKW